MIISTKMILQNMIFFKYIQVFLALHYFYETNVCKVKFVQSGTRILLVPGHLQYFILCTHNFENSQNILIS